MAIDTWDEVEDRIKQAASEKLLVDRRKEMPRGILNGRVREWRTRNVRDVLGVCIHQSGGRQTNNPIATAKYHTSADNHITPGYPLPSLCYPIAIQDSVDEPPWLCGDLKWVTYAQGAGGRLYPGDENCHLFAIVVLGAFTGPGFNKAWTSPAPSSRQMYHLQRLVEWAMEVFNFGGEGVFGHYHFGKASCPGYAISKWIEEVREKDDKANFDNLKDVQKALLMWNSECLPQHGANGEFTEETKKALTLFQRSHKMRQTGMYDPFTELYLLQKYVTPVEDENE